MTTIEARKQFGENKFSTVVRTMEDAINLATGKRKQNGAFVECEDGFLVLWEPKQLSK